MQGSVLAAGKKRRFKQPHFGVAEHEAGRKLGLVLWSVHILHVLCATRQSKSTV